MGFLSTRSNGYRIDAVADWNPLINAANLSTNPAKFRGHQNATTTVPATTWVPLPLQVNDIDNYNGHSTVTNPTRYVCPLQGLWHGFGFVAFTNTAGSYRTAALAINGAIVLGSGANVGASGDYTAVPVNDQFQLNVGDYVELWGWSGVATNTTLVPVNARTTLNLQYEGS